MDFKKYRCSLVLSSELIYSLTSAPGSVLTRGRTLYIFEMDSLIFWAVDLPESFEEVQIQTDVSSI